MTRPSLLDSLDSSRTMLARITARRASSRRGRRGLLAISYGLLLVSCESPFAPDETPVERLESSPLSATISVGETRAVTVRVLDAAGNALSNRRLFWSSQNPAVATVSQAGLVSGVAAGGAQISVNAGGKSAIIPFTVNARPVSLVRVTPSSMTIVAGGTTPLSAEALDAGGTTVVGRPVIWATANAAVATVTSTGVVTGVAAGTTNITATVDGVTGTSVLTVQPVPVASMSLTPATEALIVGQQLQLTATPRDAAGGALTGRAISWSSSAPANASVSSTGLVTALARGTATITASSEGKSATSRITVSLVPVDTVTVSPSSAALAAGQTLQLSVRIVDATGALLTGRAITWDTDQPTIASVSADGLVTALTSGRASISATVEGKSSTATINVNPVPVASISITPGAATILIGQTQQFTATTRDASNNILPGRGITWISGAPSVATVDQSGLVSAVGAGSALIFAASEGISTSVTVTVTSVGVARVNVSPTTGSVQQGRTIQLTASPVDANGAPITGRTVSWNSGSPTVASVSSTGLVTGVTPGTASITATVDGVIGTSTITVTAVPVAAVSILPNATTLTVGNTLPLTLIVTDAAGTPLSIVGRTVTWSSSTPGVASVSGSGVVTAVAPGTATIQATVDGVTGGASITVTSVTVPVASVTVSPSPTSVTEGGTRALTATARDASNNILTGRTIVWSSSNNVLAAVDQSGVVTANAPTPTGSPVTITAKATGAGVGGVDVAGTSAVTVNYAAVTSAIITPSPVNTTVGGSTPVSVALFNGSLSLSTTGRSINWSTTNTSIATVSAGGVVTGVAAGTTTLSVTASSPGQATPVTQTATISVSAIPVASVKFTTFGGTLHVGTRYRRVVTAQAMDAGGTVLPGRAITWTTPAADAPFYTIDSVLTTSGVTTIVARSAPVAGLRIVANASTGTGTVTDTLLFTSDLVPVSAVAITPPTATLVGVPQSTQVTLNAVARDSANNVIDATNGDPLGGRTTSWASSDVSIATVGVSTGQVSGVAKGTANVTATIGGTLSSAPSVITVLAAVGSIQTSLVRDSVIAGNATLGTTSGTVTVLDVSSQPIAGRAVTLSTGSTSIATVAPSSGTTDANGQISFTATGVGGGSSTPVSATAVGSGVSGSATLRVLRAVTSVQLVATPAAADSVIGTATLPITATLRDAVSGIVAGRPCTVVSSDVSIATVSLASAVSNGSGQVAFSATGVTPSATKATLTVSCEGVNGTFALRVLAPVASVTVTSVSGADSLIGTATLQLQATARDANNTTLTGRVIAWTIPSATPSGAATVSASGLVTGVLSGTANVVATSEGVAAAPFVTRLLAAVNSLTLTTTDSSVFVADTVPATVVLKDVAGNTLTGRPISWSVPTGTGGRVIASVASTTSSGARIAGVDSGATSVTASAEGKSGVITPFSVALVPVSSVTVTPNPTTLTVGDTLSYLATPKDANGNALSNRATSWQSLDASKMRFDVASGSLGRVTALDSGNVNIRATVEAINGSAAITVRLVPIDIVSFSPNNIVVQNGNTRNVTLHVQSSTQAPLEGRLCHIVGNAATIFTVVPGSASTDTGGDIALIVTGLLNGNGTITATCDPGTAGQRIGTVAVTVQ